jgi:hypothetical protein
LAAYFLDTSALATLYHEELGSDYVERILNEPGSKGIISRLSLVEMESVFAIKVRTGALDENVRSLALRRRRADIARDRLIVGPPIEPKILSLRGKAVETPRRLKGGCGPSTRCNLRSRLTCWRRPGSP